MKTVKETDYVYASTRIKAAEGRGTASERLAAFSEAESADALCALISDYVLAGSDHVAVTSSSDAADAALRYAAELVTSSVPDPATYDFLFFKYDCNNIKTAIKESVTGEHDPKRYFPFGTVSPETVRSAAADRVFSALPENLGLRAKEAIDTFETTGEARSIDLLVDRGCFEDAAASVARSNVPFFKEYAALSADSVNYTTFVRVSSSGLSPDAAAALITRAVVPGGTVAEETFGSAAAAADDHAGRIEALSVKTDDPEYRAALIGSDDPTELSLRFDRLIDRIVSKFDFTAFGPEIPAVFFIKRETEIRAFRIAASMIASGKKQEEIKKRLGLTRV